ncbi:unnamed protein product [Dovyalis caffra]|uniref:F-box domain-containing protein n=1 Tax=Dovyalis caffra TaxID=77055 RepID=A0AAV1SKS5_9ROSI|nr:unnamed protein product [Dovyalis caffra]
MLAAWLRSPASAFDHSVSSNILYNKYMGFSLKKERANRQKKAKTRARECSMAGDSEKSSRGRDIQCLLVSSCSNNKRRKTETPSSSSSEQSILCLNDLRFPLIEEILGRVPTSKSALCLQKLAHESLATMSPFLVFASVSPTFLCPKWESDCLRTMAGDDEKQGTVADQLSLLVSSCSNKRTKTETPSSSSSSEVSNFSLNDLQVLLTEEILQRLPATKSAFLCKCVCKNWYSLISTPYFVRRFITQHVKHQYEQNPSALFINYWNRLKGYILFPVSDEPMFKRSGFDLNFLPERNGSVRVSAIFNDLMLCRVDKKRDTRAGFVCEPYYFEDNQGDCTINSKYRFRVVHFARSKSQQIVLRTYRPETRQWYRSVLEGPEYRWHSNVVAYNGKLLWYNGSRIFAYDPFNPELSTFVDCSFSLGICPCIGVCQGFLRLMQFTVSAGLHRKALDIWELEDYTTQKWSLKHKIYLDAMITERLLIKQIIDDEKIVHDGNDLLKTLSFLPNNRDVVYFSFNAFLISYNCQTRVVKVVDSLPFKGGFFGIEMKFCIELPLWPTPIPKTD